jgi:DNA-binding response OmpR family regulator
MVRDLARSVLARQGYNVLEVPGGAAALEVAGRHEGPIDLMVTDVVMPHMSGHELAERLRGLRPEMRVLYTSGYDEEAIERYGLQQDALTFLPKPFTPEGLASRVRDLLDRTF